MNDTTSRLDLYFDRGDRSPHHQLRVLDEGRPGVGPVEGIVGVIVGGRRRAAVPQDPLKLHVQVLWEIELISPFDSLIHLALGPGRGILDPDTGIRDVTVPKVAGRCITVGPTTERAVVRHAIKKRRVFRSELRGVHE